MKENEVLLHGKIFPSLEKALEYNIKWMDSPVDLKEFRKFLEDRFNEVKFNLEMNPKFSNQLAFLLLRNCSCGCIIDE